MTDAELSQIEQHFRDSPNAPGNAALVFRLVAEIRRLSAKPERPMPPLPVIVPPAPPVVEPEPEGFRPTPPASPARSHHKKGK